MKNASRLAWSLPDIAPWQAQNNFIRSDRLAFVVTVGASIALSVAGFAATKLGVKLQGDVAPECAVSSRFASGASLGLGDAMMVPDIARPGREDYGFTVNCNAPFDYRLEARYGALTHETGAAPIGFTAAVPYEVVIHIPTDRVAIDDRCPGKSIRAGQISCLFTNSGDGIAMGSAGQLTLTWAPDGIPAAGNYTDKLTITVGVRQ